MSESWSRSCAFLEPAPLSSVLILLCCVHPRLEDPRTLLSTSLFPLT